MANRDELLAEIQRRGLQVPQNSPQDIAAEIQRRGLKVPNTNKMTLGQDIFEGLSRAPAAALGMIEGLGSGLYDIAGGNITNFQPSFADSLKSAFGIKSEIPGAYSGQDALRDLSSGLLKGGRALANAPGNAINYVSGQFGANIPDLTLPESINNFDYNEFTGVSGARPANNLLQGIGSFAPSLGAAGGNPYLALVLQSAGENQNPLENIGGVGLLKNTPKILSKTAKLPRATLEAGKKAVGQKPATDIRARSENLAKSVADEIAHDQLGKHETRTSESFKSINKTIKDANINKVEIAKHPAPKFFEKLPESEREIISKAFKTKKPEDIQAAYRQAASTNARLEAKAKKSGLAPDEAILLDQGKTVWRNLKGAYSEAARRAGGEELVKKVNDTNIDWQENVLTNKYNDILTKYRTKELTAIDMVKKALGNAKYRAQLLGKSPKIAEMVRTLEEVDKMPAPKIADPAIARLMKDAKWHNTVEMATSPKKLASAIFKTLIGDAIKK